MEEITEEQPSEITSPDTENATYFKPNEADDSAHYRRLRLYNRGTWKDRREENKAVTHRADNLAIFDAVAGQLDLATSTRTAGRNLFDTLNLQKLGRSVKKIAFAVCCVIANDHCPRGKRHWPTQGPTDSHFLDVGDDLGISETEQFSLIYVVKARRPA